MGVGLLPETARRLRSRLGREVVVDLLVLAALCVEYALRPAQRREIRGIVSISVANLRCFLWRDAPPVVAAGAYGLRGWNWRHADFYVRPRDRPAPWLRDVARPAPLRNATLRLNGDDGGAFLVAGAHFAAPTRLLPPTAFTLPSPLVSLRGLRTVPPSVVQRVVRVDLEPFGFEAVGATWLDHAPDRRRIAVERHKFGVGAEENDRDTSLQSWEFLTFFLPRSLAADRAKAAQAEEEEEEPEEDEEIAEMHRETPAERRRRLAAAFERRFDEAAA